MDCVYMYHGLFEFSFKSGCSFAVLSLYVASFFFLVPSTYSSFVRIIIGLV